MVRIAVLDSGVHLHHPHIGRIAGGYNSISGADETHWLDELGHGTAVTAAIQDLNPEAEILVVKIFQGQLRTSLEAIIRGARWAVEQGAQWLNLSLGTSNPDHSPALAEALQWGARWVSAAEQEGRLLYPGSLSGAIGVVADPTLDRSQYRRLPNGLYAAAPFPRTIPGVPPERNLQGISFAVANLTGLLSRQEL